MTARTRLVALLCAACATAALLSATAVTAPALAAGNPVLKQCQSHGQLSGQFTLAQLRHALSILPTELKQYTNCQDVIQQAILAAKRKPGANAPTSGSGSGGSFLPTPVIIALVVLILAAVTFGALAVRRRRAGADGDGPGGSGPPPPPAI